MADTLLFMASCLDSESVEPFEDERLFTFKLLRQCHSLCSRREGGLTREGVAQGPENAELQLGGIKGSTPLAGGLEGNCSCIVPVRGEEKRWGHSASFSPPSASSHHCNSPNPN